MLCGSPFLLALLHVHELPGIFWHTARGWPTARGSGRVVSAGGLGHTTLLPALAMMGHRLKFSEAAAGFQISGPLFPRLFISQPQLPDNSPACFLEEKSIFSSASSSCHGKKLEWHFISLPQKPEMGFSLSFYQCLIWPPVRSHFHQGTAHFQKENAIRPGLLFC